ncbi:MAG: helix-turn-helix domain-containing protein [Ruminococcaceae bacterium]|nr:helix-turn-helix domain-containing protein [Oscillospiraceae bacterium]
MKNREIISLEQLYKMLHISKRKAAWMLQNGIIPCEIRNTSTHKYSIRKEDVLSYLEKSDQEKRREIPVGIFSTKKANTPHSSEPQDPDYGGCFDYTNLKLRGKERAMFKQMLEEQLQDISDILTIDEVASLMGYNTKTILRYVQKQYFYAVNISGKYYISKRSVINYLATDKAFENKQKSEWHNGTILLFIQRK